MKEQEKTEHPNHTFNPEEIGNFRKVNFLMNEFAYYGNCEYKEISRDELKELQEKCARVNAISPINPQDDENDWCYEEGDIELAKELLPTCSGFFYGNTDYNYWYFYDVHEVLEWVTGVRKNLADDEVVLMYCWW